MPFDAYSAYFRAEELGVSAAAYDAAWQDLWTERLTLGAEQTLVLKKNLALRRPNSSSLPSSDCGKNLLGN
jgi:hypothetical protein